MNVRTFRPPVLPAGQKLPVTIVTGFLGSGKTALINHILSYAEGLRVVVLVNEFGEIGIDGDLVIAAEAGMVELSNGCICCSVNDDLVDGLVQVLSREDRVDHIVIETSGIADPLPVALTLQRSEFRSCLRLDAIIAVADAEQFSLDMFDGVAARSQLENANVVLVNKTDVATPAQLASVEARLAAINPNASIVRTLRCALPLPLILDVGAAPSIAAEPFYCHGAADGFTSIAFESDIPFSLARFQAFLDRDRPPGLFRAKGFVSMVETGRRYVFHLVGGRFSVEEDKSESQMANRLVLIGRDLDRDHLIARLNDCLAVSALASVGQPRP
ncbi:GTP-binding protein [Aquabacter sp. CN5-332]|uniref:CobW family GTP-binding protein n=1 Tax=Aquabacter sp. CN5-332 TaxID=3156608 RepID=UPI0032B5B665